MRAHCHACNTSFATSLGGAIRCPRCGRVINLGTIDHFFDGPQESAYFGWSDDVAQRRLWDPEESTVVQAVATVGNAAYRLFRSVASRVAGRPVEAVVRARAADEVEEPELEQELDHYTDDLRLS